MIGGGWFQLKCGHLFICLFIYLWRFYRAVSTVRKDANQKKKKCIK